MHKIVIVTALIALFTACQRGESGALATSNVAATSSSFADPCSLVSAQDMGVMFGELKEGPMASTGLRDERQCNFTNMAGSWIKLSVYDGADRWESEKNMTNALSPRDVGGLGDEAFAIRRGTDAEVYVRKGESILHLSCSCPAETAEAITRVVTTRL